MSDTDPRLDDAGDPNLRMNAYYYSFERTGVGVVDAILSAVATAGKAYHNTSEWAEGWSDEDSGDTSHAARIQAAADEAARRIRVDSEKWQASWDTAAAQAATAVIELRAENERLRKLIDDETLVERTVAACRHADWCCTKGCSQERGMHYTGDPDSWVVDVDPPPFKPCPGTCTCEVGMIVPQVLAALREESDRE